MKSDAHLFYCMIRDFLSVYLPKQRGVSNNTIRSYREALNLLIEYIRTSQGKPLGDIGFQYVTKEAEENFLQWLETERGCAVSTRNQRLSAIKSFLKYAAGKDKSLMPLYLETDTIPKKKDTRAQEMLDLKLGDIRLDEESPHVIITGKGAKTRLVPVMEKTCRHFESYKSSFHSHGCSDEYLFYIDRKGVRSPMSIDNVEKFVARYGENTRKVSSEVPEHLKPHTWRNPNFN